MEEADEHITIDLGRNLSGNCRRTNRILGGFMFVQRIIVSEGFWSIGVGLIMVGLNITRYFCQLRMSER